MMGKKILMLVGDYAEDYETMVPFQALQMIGQQKQNKILKSMSYIKNRVHLCTP